MKYRTLSVLPFAWAALFLVAAILASDASFATVVRVEIESAKVLSLVGALLATFAFDRGDYLRRGWGLTSVCSALLLLRDAALAPGIPATMLGVPTVAWGGVVIVTANLVSIAGVVVLARTWTVAGLEPIESKVTRRSVIVVAMLVAIVVSGPALLGDARAVGRGQLDALVSMLSDVADAVSLVVIAPVLLTALALRGGVLTWPWGLLTASLLFWLAYDAGVGLRNAFEATSAAATVAIEACRGIALLFGFSSGVAQALAVTERDATIPPE